MIPGSSYKKSEEDPKIRRHFQLAFSLSISFSRKWPETGKKGNSIFFPKEIMWETKPFGKTESLAVPSSSLHYSKKIVLRKTEKWFLFPEDYVFGKATYAGSGKKPFFRSLLIWNGRPTLLRARLFPYPYRKKKLFQKERTKIWLSCGGDDFGRGITANNKSQRRFHLPLS